MNKIESDLQLAGFQTKRTEDDRLMIEGTSKNDVDFVIEEDFDAWWVYEYTGKDYHSVDAFGSMDEAIECAKELIL